MTQKVLFVCLGNICRSPAAENIMEHLIRTRAPDAGIFCDSAGTAAYHVGSPPDRRMQQALREIGIEPRGRARQITVRDLAEFDLILAMDRDNYSDIHALDPKGQYRHKIKMMCSYCSEHRDQEVPDPYYGGDSGFRYVIDLLMDACSGLLKSLDTTA
jgi:protein-tyrosine phosphatase